MSQTIMILAFCVLAVNASNSQFKRDLTALGLIDQEEQGDSLISIISFVKTQIKTFIEDLLWEAFKSIRTMILKFKRRVYKRLANYTISDIFNFFFEGIFQFVSDEDSELEAHHHAKLVPLEPAWLPRTHNDSVDPYMLNRLIHSGEK